MVMEPLLSLLPFHSFFQLSLAGEKEEGEPSFDKQEHL